MNAKKISILAFGMMFFCLILGAANPVLAATSSVVADQDTFTYEANPDSTYGSQSNVNFGNTSSGSTREYAFFHFSFADKPAQFSSAVINISYSSAAVAFYATFYQVSGSWDESTLTWNLMLSTLTIESSLGAVQVDAATAGTYKSIALNVTSTIQGMAEGANGISICINKSLADAEGFAQGVSSEDCIDISKKVYCPVLIWTYEPGIPIWIYFIIVAIAAVVLVVVIKKRKSARSATPGVPQVPMVPKESLIKEPPAPQEPSTPSQPPSPPETPGSPGTSPPSDNQGPQEPPAL